MAWKTRRGAARRRPRTHWETAPASLSRVVNEPIVRGDDLQDLLRPGAAGNCGTVACLPFELTEYIDEGGALASSLRESATSRRRLLRLVGMFRPLTVLAEVENETFQRPGTEVRYAVVRGPTDLGLNVYGPQAGPQLPHLNQPDLFAGDGLGSERIAWMRSYILPDVTDMNYNTEAYVVLLHYQWLLTVPWWQNNEMTIVDLKSKRSVSVESKMYLLRQARFANGKGLDNAPWHSAKLYHADYARLLVAGS